MVEYEDALFVISINYSLILKIKSYFIEHRIGVCCY